MGALLFSREDSKQHTGKLGRPMGWDSRSGVDLGDESWQEAVLEMASYPRLQCRNEV